MEAATGYRRCLGLKPPAEVRPELLLCEAQQLARAGVARAEVDECYLRVRTLYRGTEHARTADYRRARLAWKAGDARTATGRYERFLANWSLDSATGRRACADLLQAYLEAGQYVRALLLGDVMRARIGGSGEFRRCLPALLSACVHAGLPEQGLAMVDAAIAQAPPEKRHECAMHKARFLLNLGREAQAESLLKNLEADARSPQQRYGAALLRARLLLAGQGEDAGIDICRTVATAPDCPGALRAEALRVLGGHYERTGRYHQAALAYNGRCPVNQSEDVQ
jgi:hypothetical protein